MMNFGLTPHPMEILVLLTMLSAVIFLFLAYFIGKRRGLTATELFLWVIGSVVLSWLGFFIGLVIFRRPSAAQPAIPAARSPRT